MELRKLTLDHLDLLRSIVANGHTVRMTVTGHSMSPAIWRRDVVHLRHTNSAYIGQVVLTARGRPLLHRVRALESRDGVQWVQTQGDALVEADPWLPASAVIARVVRVEPARFAARWLRRGRRALGALRGRLR